MTQAHTKGLNPYKVFIGSLNADRYHRPNVDAKTPEAADALIRKTFKLGADDKTVIVDRETGEILFENPPELKPAEPESKRLRGRPALNIDSESICDALKITKDVRQAAINLGCSRGYIYKIVGIDKIREIIAQ